MSRGSGFATGAEPSADDEGHALPSDRSMQFVAVDLVCGVCYPQTRVLLARFAHDTYLPAFDSAQIYSRGDNKAVELQHPDGLGGRDRLRITCPRCGQMQVRRFEKVEQALQAIWEPGAVDKIRVVPI